MARIVCQDAATYFSCTTQVFRAYRESFEQEKETIEQRFRDLLEEALEDAIFLSAANSQLKLQVQDLKQGTWNYVYVLLCVCVCVCVCVCMCM